MRLVISRECELSADKSWETVVESDSHFLARYEIPGKGHRLIIAMAGNRDFFKNLGEYGHVFIVDPIEAEGYDSELEALLDEGFMRQVCTDDNRYALMTRDGEGPTIDFVNDRDGFPGEMTFRFYGEEAKLPTDPLV